MNKSIDNNIYQNNVLNQQLIVHNNVHYVHKINAFLVLKDILLKDFPHVKAVHLCIQEIQKINVNLYKETVQNLTFVYIASLMNVFNVNKVIL